MSIIDNLSVRFLYVNDSRISAFSNKGKYCQNLTILKLKNIDYIFYIMDKRKVQRIMLLIGHAVENQT